MVENFPGPHELRFSYTTLIGAIPLTHTQRLSLALTTDPNPGAAFNNINAITRGLSVEPDLAAVVEAWLTLIAPRFPEDAVFGIVELWKYEPGGYQASFISAYSPTKTTGDNAVNSSLPAAQEVLTFRTMEGGVMRVTWIETTSGSTQPLPYPTSITGVDEIFEFVIGLTNWILARDTSYPFAALRFLGGQNEKTFRQRWR
jgi:hypothetical protein